MILGALLDNIRIVLVNTSHPGNIGSSARAMKTMGLHGLYLVSPQFFPDAKAIELAAGAADVLDTAVVVAELDQAILDSQLVIGVSARSRSLPWPMLSPRELGEKVKAESCAGSKIAIVFGREQSGLTNDELNRCHYHVQIPSNPEYGSLNLASAVQVIAYELRVAMLGDQPVSAWDYRDATAGDLEGFYEHLEKVLVEIDFLNPAAPRKLMPRLRRLFNRVRMDVMEINILRGILGMMEKRLAKHGIFKEHLSIKTRKGEAE